ncbi:MAG TPA: GNAT family N-acetyltransferase [Clostridia bacterium]|nr:GNAT family N-acetyltransferase [Clostridia bacterium]
MKEVILKNGEKVLIRKAVQSDAKSIIRYIHEISGESNNLTFGEGEFNVTVSQEEDMIQKVSEADNKLFLVVLKDEKIIGNLSFMGGNRPRTRHMGDLGMTVLKSYWGEGIGGALLEYLIEWCENNPIVRKINLQVKVDNENAIKLYEKFNFKREGHIERFFLIHGKFFDAYSMGLLID